MNASWSAEQREWLQAMGYDLLAPAGTSVVGDAPADDAATPPAVVPATASGDETRRLRPAPPRATSAAAPDLADPLLRALLRASRCDDLAQLAEVAGDLTSLRRNPAAKRALWPALRTLRVRSRR